jgi:hypothetical protein
LTPILRVFRGQYHKIFCFRFFHESSSPEPLKLHYDHFKFCLKIHGDIHKKRCTTGDNYTGGKFETGINDTGGKFATGTTGVFDTGSNNGNNIRLLTPESELREKNVSMC